MSVEVLPALAGRDQGAGWRAAGRRSLRAVIPALSLGLLGVIAAVALAATPSDDSPMIGVILTPFSPHDIAALVERTDARIVRPPPVPGVWIIASDRPGLLAQLRRLNGILLFRPFGALGCPPGPS